MIGAWLWALGAPCAFPALALAVLGLVRAAQADGWWWVVPTLPPRGGPRSPERIVEIVVRLLAAEATYATYSDPADELWVWVRRVGEVWIVQVGPAEWTERDAPVFTAATLGGVASIVRDQVHAIRAYGS